MENQTQTFIIKYGEVALKGKNKPYFERVLVERIRRSLKAYKEVSLVRDEGIIILKVGKPLEIEHVIKSVSKVFGIASISPALEINTALEKIEIEALKYMKSFMETHTIKTFKVKTKRGYKGFPMLSPELARHIGGLILSEIEDLKVDVRDPDAYLYIDVRRVYTYIYTEKYKGRGGLPLGTNGKALLLLSGGIDSPVAGFLMANRGMLLEAVHFHAYPYTNQQAREKVVDLAKTLSQYCGKIKLYSVNLLEIQKNVDEKCPSEEGTLITRRFMMKIAEKIAEKNQCESIITGESLGQVASQTIGGLNVTNAAVNSLVMRPLIGMDKVDIMDIAKDIGTFDISIEAHEDCCTLFLPKHPTTKPKLEKIIKSESKIENEAELIEAAIESMEVEFIKSEE